tara:strand:- start:154 stop:471 length:318 start_codon:yes stop_codon:yes gene_type:complete
MQPFPGGMDLMAKVNKAFSIDPETFLMLDRYCAASETWDKRRSRSSVVNEAIRWYLQGDNADMITDSHRDLLARYRDKCIEVAELERKVSPKKRAASWWRRLLGI